MSGSVGRWAARGLVAALVVLAAACSSKDSTGPGSSYAGGWEGMTAAGGVVRFYVEPSGMPAVVVGLRVVGNLCTDSGVFALHREAPDTMYTVTGSAMTVSVPSTYLSLSLTGNFTSATQAAGSATIVSTHCDGSLTTTWSAVKASAAAKDVTGVWTGTYSTSLVATATMTLTLVQTGSSVTGSYTSTNGGEGSVSGTIVGKVGTFHMVQTTSGCPGSFTGHAAMALENAGLQVLSLGWTGTDCLGTHTHARGNVSLQ